MAQERAIAAVAVPVWDEAIEHSEPLLPKKQDDDEEEASASGNSIIDYNEEDMTEYVAVAEEEQTASQLMGKLQHCSFAFGLFVGFFVESGALAAHVLYQGTAMQWYQEGDARQEQVPLSTSQLVSFSLLWATATALLPCIALLFLRSILIVVADRQHLLATTAAGVVGRARLAVNFRHKNSLQECLWFLESRFGLGSFFGVSLSATVMDLFLGVRRHILLTAALLVTVTLCFVFVSGGSEVNEEWEDEEDEHDVEYEVAFVDGATHEQQTHEAMVAYPSLGKKMDSVDPSAIHAVELKEGSLLIV